MQRKDIEAVAAQVKAMVAQANTPMRRRRLEVDLIEGRVRADILEAMDSLDLSQAHPADVMEMYDVYQAVAGANGAPGLAKALDTLEAAGYEDAISLRVRAAVLYPELAKPELEV